LPGRREKRRNVSDIERREIDCQFAYKERKDHPTLAVEIALATSGNAASEEEFLGARTAVTSAGASTSLSKENKRAAGLSPAAQNGRGLSSARSSVGMFVRV
jgi:hypothetical protein